MAAQLVSLGPVNGFAFLKSNRYLKNVVKSSKTSEIQRGFSAGVLLSTELLLHTMKK